MVDISIVTMIGIPTNITGGAPPCLDLFHPFLKFRILEDWILVKGINPR